MGGPRKGTITKAISKAVLDIEQDKCKRALTTLKNLESKLQDTKDSSPREPNAYARFVKANFKKFQEANKDKKAIQIMPLIAAAWKKENS